MMFCLEEVNNFFESDSPLSYLLFGVIFDFVCIFISKLFNFISDRIGGFF